MKSYFWKFFFCVVPCVLAGWVAFDAISKYRDGKSGGAKFGVDLVGGTILIYEVDLDKLPNGELPRDWNPQEVARRLKSRIDPGEPLELIRYGGGT